MESFKLARLVCTAVLVVLPLANLAAAQKKSAGSKPAYRIGSPDTVWVERTLETLSLREKIAQLIQIRVPGKFLNRRSQEFKAIAEQVKQYKLGGVVLFSGNVYESAILLNELQMASKLPLLVSADFERGASFRINDTTSFPWTMALGATGSEALAYQQGVITAQESRALGVHWIFAPVMDVNNNPDNPVINIRSFGEDPQLVARLGAAFIRGARSAGVLTTAKHFPGHGDTATDSHIGLPVVESNLARLQSLEFVPFKSAVEAGVDSIMTAHVAVPQVTGKREVPATLSPAILTDLLRDTLKFDGLVVTDALEMGGITDQYWCGLAASRAIQAGADVLLLPPDALVAINEIERAIKRGDITVSRIDQSVRKVLRAKSRLLLQKSRFVSIDRIGEIVASPQHAEIAQEIADRSITAVKDDQHLLPVNPLSNPQVFSLVLTSDLETSPGSVFQAELRRHFPSMRAAWGNARTSPELSASIEKTASQSDLIVCSTLVRLSSGREINSIPEDQLAIIQKLVASNKPLIWLSFGNPYVLRMAPNVGTYLCTFSHSDVSQIAAAKALAGEIAITGKMPVSIPGYSGIGSGLQIPKLEMTLKPNPPESAGYSINTFDETRQLLTSHAKAGLFPGAALIVGHKGSVVLQCSIGRQGPSADSKEVRIDTPYDLASLSNIVGILSAAMLVAESGDLILEAAVHDYLPELYTSENRTRIRDLLNNISSKPRAKPEQVDPDYAALKEIVSRAAGVPLDRFLPARLFVPLGMKTVSFAQPKYLRKRVDPAGARNSLGLRCSAHDLAVFAQMLLNRGVYDHRRYFNPGTIARFTGFGAVSGQAQSLGWLKPSEANWTGRLFSSTAFGYSDASANLFWIDPEKQLFIILLAPSGGPASEQSKIAAFQGLLAESIIRAISLSEP